VSRARWSSSRGDSPFRGEKEQSWSRGVRKKEERAEGGGVRTSGPTPVSESDIQAVAQRCGDSRVFSVRRRVGARGSAKGEGTFSDMSEKSRARR
jgi:hypothetical protein